MAIKDDFYAFLENHPKMDKDKLGPKRMYVELMEQGSAMDINLQKLKIPGFTTPYECTNPTIWSNVIKPIYQHFFDGRKGKNPMVLGTYWNHYATINKFIEFLNQDNRYKTEGYNWDATQPPIIIEEEENGSLKKNSPLSRPLQQISYGAPGTGKSFGINEEIKNGKLDAVRTTFHPDSDYSTFVGAYKPAMGKAKVYGAQGPLQHQGNDVEEDKITYKFVPQAFTKAYVKAWQKMSEPNDEGKIVPQILVIEEINRGNCAQIFGDLFQLLDRNDDGYSSYPIQADEDLRQHIAQELANCERLPNKFETIKNGTKLMLPPNFYIWATMNTSDQSLFPIDSAFKRRWEWKYMKISNAGKNWKITAGDKTYDWWNFIEKINNEIAAATSSDDKKLGYFFCKPNEGDAINAERFVGKVIFYLWNDVFKDEAPAFFNVIENTEPSFDAFFEQNGEVNNAAVQKFMENVGVEVKIMTEAQEEQSE